MQVTSSRIFRRSLLALLLLLSNLYVTAASASEWLYTVRPGDNIWNITERYLKHMGYWQRLQALNEVAEPRRIPPGTRLRIPVAWMKLEPATAQLDKVQGAVRVEDAQGQARAMDAPLQSGDRIVSGADGSAVIVFADGSTLLLQSDTTVVLDTLSAYGDSGMVDTRVRLPSGRVDTHAVPRKGPATRFEINTPAAVAAVRGTHFRVAAAGDSARSEVLEGRVGVAAGGVTRGVPAGYGTLASVGKPPAKPRALLPAPQLDQAGRLERLPAGVSWSVVAGAAAYRTQLFAQDGRLLDEQRSERPSVYWESIADGHYRLRVRAIAADGLEGMDREWSFELNARPVPPMPTAPGTGSVARELRPVFTWARPEGIASYRFQLARDAGFRDMVIDTAAHTAESLQPSVDLAYEHYHWRVASIAADGEQGPYADAQPFEIKPPPENPALEPPGIDDEHLAFAWPQAQGATRYQFQLARDDKFKDVVVDTETADPKVQLPRPASGVYYARARSIADDGYAPPFGPPQRISVPHDNYWPLLILLVPLFL